MCPWSVSVDVHPGLPHDSWQLFGVTSNHQSSVAEGSVHRCDGETDLTFTANGNIAMWKGRREGSGGDKVYSFHTHTHTHTHRHTHTPSDYLQRFCQSSSFHKPLHFGEGDREEVGEGGSYSGLVAGGSL